MKRVMFFILVLTAIAYSQPILNADTTAQRTFSDLKYATKVITDSLAEDISNIVGTLSSSKFAMWVITDGTPALSLATRFDSNPTIAISGDTVTISDPSGELNLSGEFDSNDKDYTILSHTVYQVRALFSNGFSGLTTSVWFESRLSGFISDESTLTALESLTDYLRKDVFDDSLANYDLLYGTDSTAFRTFSNLKYATKVITGSLAEDIAGIADSNFALSSEMKTVDDSLASDIAENKLTTHFFTGTDSIHYGEDSIVVTHGVGSTPSFISIQLVSDGFGFQTWVSGINSLTFYVRRSDIGLKTINSSIQFKWMAKK